MSNYILRNLFYASNGITNSCIEDAFLIHLPIVDQAGTGCESQKDLKFDFKWVYIMHNKTSKGFDH